ncbi:MAG TPA: MGMT family protein [Bacteroidales bacterium]|nr:MGMT family protein [Bacteroidales bacterium]HRZ50290.1 MGMT family protein [Bacteroidales bacterium]
MHDQNFFEKVWWVAGQIPYGRVTSYGAIASFLSAGSAARMVGWAMNASHTSRIQIPAHRVVNRSGMLTGKHHFGHPDLMQQLLENEGISVVNDRIVDFKRLFWNPADHLVFPF